MEKIIFLGGDKRMIYAAEALSGKYTCRVCGFGNYDADIYENTYDYAVLPLQKSPDGITIPSPFSGGTPPLEYNILGRIIKYKGIVLTGNTCPSLEKICFGSSLTLVNYLDREELAVANAVPTAEGALEIAINKLPVTIFGSAALITGFGRIAKILTKYLLALGAHVIVACRKKSDLKWAEIYGCKAVDITNKAAFSSAAAEADVVFNTVPHEVFDNSTIQALKEKTLYIELASSDGINAAVAQKHNIEIIIARGLPGKTAPVTAGRIIAETILNILSERSDSIET